MENGGRPAQRAQPPCDREIAAASLSYKNRCFILRIKHRFCVGLERVAGSVPCGTVPDVRVGIRFGQPEMRSVVDAGLVPRVAGQVPDSPGIAAGIAGGGDLRVHPFCNQS